MLTRLSQLSLCGSARAAALRRSGDCETSLPRLIGLAAQTNYRTVERDYLELETARDLLHIPTSPVQRHSGTATAIVRPMLLRLGQFPTSQHCRRLVFFLLHRGAPSLAPYGSTLSRNPGASRRERLRKGAGACSVSCRVRHRS